MYARIIPSLRLPRRLQYFDYAVPPKLEHDIAPGDVVKIEFRRRKAWGIVQELVLEQSAREVLKTVLAHRQDLRLNRMQVEFLVLFAREFFVSPGTVANMLLRTLPYRHFGTKSGSGTTANRRLAKKVSSDSLVVADTDERIKFVKNILRASKNGTVLLIHPEIQTVKRWEHALAEFLPLSFHRQLPTQEYWQRYARQLSQPSRLIIATRVGLFLPFHTLRHVIIDDEENQNHRQSEQNPRYHTDQAVRLLQTVHGCSVSLLSSFPRMTTLSAVKGGNLRIVEAREKQQLPSSVKIASLPEERQLGNYGVLSASMEKALHSAIRNKRHSLLYFNRRGESNSLKCHDCGFTYSCPRCRRPLAVHKKNAKKQSQLLRCHLCSHQEDVSLQCPQCGSTDLKKRGTGIQKITDQVKSSFPQAVTEVIDSGTGLSSRPTPDIIIATQKVFSLSDLPKFSVIGILNADQDLQLPDFSAAETAFRTISRLVGLAAASQAQCVIQTYSPAHHTVQMGSRQDYWGFYEEEIKFRKQYAYPPSSQLVRLILKDSRRESLVKKAKRYYEQVSTARPSAGIHVVQPGPAFTEKIRGQYQWQIVIKFSDKHWPEVKNLINLSGDEWLVDINPLNLL
ncbi:MAG: primosomal protein N' [bacterium]|nr:primosomal protein N' [bacterium]